MTQGPTNAVKKAGDTLLDGKATIEHVYKPEDRNCHVYTVVFTDLPPDADGHTPTAAVSVGRFGDDEARVRELEQRVSSAHRHAASNVPGLSSS